MTPNHDVVQKLLGALHTVTGIVLAHVRTHAVRNAVLAVAAPVIKFAEAQLAGEPVDPSPTNDCIRAAKKVIAALNLPDGAGVAWDMSGPWCVFISRPELVNSTWFPSEGGTEGHFFFYLPPTAIPPWPGDCRESWITALSEEVTE
jgi:hypothetical protein